MLRKLIFALTLLAALPLFAASDTLTVGTLTATSGSVAAVPVYVRDNGGSPLGMDQSTDNRIQAFGFKVTFSPTSAVSAATFTRGGVLQGLTPLYETVLTPPGAVGYVGSFAQSTNPVPFDLNAAAPGNLIGNLNVTIPQGVAAGTTITLTVEPVTATLSNQAGTVDETGNNGKLAITNGTITIVPRSDSLFYLVTPCRIIDTRNANGPQGGPALGAGATRNITVAGVCGIPTGVSAISINVAVVAPSGGGYLTLFTGPSNVPLPLASTINYQTNRTLANNAIVKVGSDTINVYDGGPTLNFVIDVNGYFK
jgi:hypothetical protein